MAFAYRFQRLATALLLAGSAASGAGTVARGRRATSCVTILSMPGRRHGNPYFRWFCESLADAGARVVSVRDLRANPLGFDILHVHFPTHFLTQTALPAAVLWSVALRTFFAVTKLSGRRIVYTVHNVVPFGAGRRRLVMPFLRFLHERVDGYVFLNASSRDEFYATFPDQRSKRSVTIPHGPYPVRLLSADERARKRAELVGTTDALVVGLLGNVKRYKGLEALASVPTRLAGGRAVKLVVAGRIEGEYLADATRVLERLAPSVLVRIDRALSDTELDELIQAVDVVFMPYTKGWNSGAAILALSNRTSIVASDLPVFRDLEVAAGGPWVTTYARATPADAAIRGAFEAFPAAGPAAADEERLTAFLDAVSFRMGAERLVAFYREIAPRPRGTTPFPARAG